MFVILLLLSVLCVTPDVYDAPMEKLSQGVIRNVLWYFGDYENGWEPGHFTRLLLAAFQCADPQNTLRLEVGFPDYAWAMRTAMRDEDGMGLLVAMAGIAE
jgi:hypothetical protein